MKAWIKVVLILFIIGLTAAILIWFFVINKPPQNIEKSKVAFTLNAKELYDSYKNDKRKSDSLYNDKVIVIAGVLSKVEKSDSLVIADFTFETDPMFGDKGVRCTMLPKYNLSMSHAMPGTQIKIKGQCKGYADDVILEHCSVLK
jgi:hypothetical protein